MRQGGNSEFKESARRRDDMTGRTILNTDPPAERRVWYRKEGERRIMNLFHKVFLRGDHVCPWWLGFTFDNPVRRLFHDTEKILRPYVTEGMTAIDIGCGMGYFSIGLARLVGEKGAVISVDLQEKMLDGLRRRAKRAGVSQRIYLHQCRPESIGVKDPVDFALTFWMVHEVPHRKGFLNEIFSILTPMGKYLLVEPKMHVSQNRFEEIVKDGSQIGFRILEHPKISFSRAALFGKQ
jgi:ubiquinone/menaquinone biosynthesis C-methylase UbiE